MGKTYRLDTCQWCGSGTSSIQINSGTDVGLCPECCPDIDHVSEVPDNAPPSWFHMDDDEREDWMNGMSMEEIMEEYNWGEM